MKLKPETIQQHRARQARYLQNVHRLCTCSNCETQKEGVSHKHRHSAIVLGVCMALAALLLVCRGCTPANAGEFTGNPGKIAGYSVDQWADAIYQAEGGDKTKHPYGILTRYKVTTPRQACINTVSHYWRDYSKLPIQTRQRKRFLEYAQERYAPLQAKNDPTGLNANWQRNVNYYLHHPKGA